MLQLKNLIKKINSYFLFLQQPKKKLNTFLTTFLAPVGFLSSVSQQFLFGIVLTIYITKIVFLKKVGEIKYDKTYLIS